VRTEEAPAPPNTGVKPLGGPQKQFNVNMDISKMSMSEMRQEMDDVLQLAKDLNTTIDNLGYDEQTHYLNMMKGLREAHANAEKHLTEICGSAGFNHKDVDLWVDMLRDKTVDQRTKDYVASFAAASQRFASKEKESMRTERDAAIKRAHDYEAQIECMKKDSQPAKTGVSTAGFTTHNFGETAKPIFHSQTTTVKAVNAYYDQFGDKGALPFGQSPFAEVKNNSFSSLISGNVQRYLANPSLVTATQTTNGVVPTPVKK